MPAPLMTSTTPDTASRHQRTPRWRLKRLDWILLTLLAMAACWLYWRASAGIHYQWRWHDALTLVLTPRADGSLPYLFQGLITTLRLSLWGLILALGLGLLLGLARHSRHPLLRGPALAYIQLVRNVPPLVFVFIFYFFISSQLIPLLGLESLLREHPGNINGLQQLLFGPARLWENLACGVACIGLLSAAYVAEIVRAGLAQIPSGQLEAAHSLGLSRWCRFRHVIFPQLLGAITPALAGQAISLVKDSSIISLISIQELTFTASEIANSSGLIFEIWLIVGAIYLLLCLGLSLLFGLLEKRSRRHLKH